MHQGFERLIKQGLHVQAWIPRVGGRDTRIMCLPPCTHKIKLRRAPCKLRITPEELLVVPPSKFCTDLKPEKPIPKTVDEISLANETVKSLRTRQDQE